MYTDILVRIKNALMRKRERVKLPYSQLNLAILESLVKEGYLSSAQRKGRGVKRIIDVELKYDEERPQISGIKFWSRPSRKLYLGYKEIRRSKQGFGHYFLSTPKGILTDREAKRARVGGEVLFEIW